MEYNIYLIVKEAECKGVDWIHPAQYMDKRWIL